MGYDGAKGLMSMKRRGARTIGQDEKSCVVYGMPKVAYNIGAVEKQIPLENIAASIYALSRGQTK
jgi:two-component system chemotaxis response regulator CheB